MRNHMTMPGFTAGHAIYRSGGRYGSLHPTGANHQDRVYALVLPSLYDLINVGLGELLEGKQLLAEMRPWSESSPARCNLACGEERVDCFREGGSTQQCDQAHRQCLWDCFFAA